MRELTEWWRRRRDIGLTFALLRTMTLCGLLFAVFLVPWHRTVLAPAVLDARYTPVFAPEGGQIKRLLVHTGDRVRGGQPVADLEAPQLAHDLEQATLRLEQLATERGDLGVQKDLRTTLVVTAEYESQARLLANLTAETEQLHLMAPHDGIVVDMERGLDGVTEPWVQKGETMFAVVDPSDARLRAYVGEEDLPRIAPDAHARFYPGDGLYPILSSTVIDIDSAGVRVLDDPYVSSTNGGPILVKRDASGSETPTRAYYELHLKPSPDTVGLLPPHATPGVVMIDAHPESMIAHFKRHAISVLQRESGF
jgi:putative peptide zinc metalloprotease protein